MRSVRAVLPILAVCAGTSLAEARPFTCALQPDGRTVRVAIATPVARDAPGTVNCRFATGRAGTTFQISCTREVAPGGAAAEICVETYDKGGLTRMVGGDGDCVDPTPAGATDTEDDDVDVETLADPSS